MFANFLKFELKNLLRDEITRVMLFYPIVLGGLVRLLINRSTRRASCQPCGSRTGCFGRRL